MKYKILYHLKKKAIDAVGGSGSCDVCREKSDSTYCDELMQMIGKCVSIYDGIMETTFNNNKTTETDTYSHVTHLGDVKNYVEFLNNEDIRKTLNLNVKIAAKLTDEDKETIKKYNKEITTKMLRKCHTDKHVTTDEAYKEKIKSLAGDLNALKEIFTKFMQVYDIT